jgi:GntR family transcriptional regulator, transcriptional repressor for pyruvate dehydrogenase complex
LRIGECASPKLRQSRRVGLAISGDATLNEIPHVLPRIRNVLSYQEVFNVIESEILGGRLKTGDIVPTETALSKALGVNRSTVREGIRLLEQTGLVRRRDDRRLYVSVPAHSELSGPMERAMILHQISVREYWEVQMALEPLAASLAAKRVTAKGLEALNANLLATEQAQLAGKPIIELDVEFHRLIAEASGNRALNLAREPIFAVIFLAVTPVMQLLEQSASRLAKAHRKIFDAIRDGDAKTAEIWMARHMMDLRRGYEVLGMDMEKSVDSLKP